MEKNEYCNDNRSSRAKGVMQLLLSILIIAFLMFYALPRLMPVLGLKPMAEFIDERNINANVYFYTDVEEFNEASINMNNTWAYTPVGPNSNN